MPERKIEQGTKKEPTAPFFKSPDHKLFEAHNDFATHILRKFFGRQFLKDEDYVQSAYLGLAEAASRYDPEGPAQFQTLAFIYIRRAIIAEIQSRSILKKKTYQKVRHWRRTEDLLAQKLQRFPSWQEVAGELGIVAEEAEETARLAEIHPPHSLAQPAYQNSESELLDIVPDENAPFEEDVVDEIYVNQLMREIEEYLAELVPTQREIIELHFLGGLAVSQIAEDQGVSFQAVNQRKNLGLGYLAERLVA